MVGAVFRPEAELTLFLRMRTKEIDKTGKIYSDRRVIPLLQEIGVADRKFPNSRFCACTVKICQKTR